ncbi:putative signal peptide-containing protein [Cryptosporidium canis]|uniref:Signal peptide-containing protein n=1 Tax=Cryptosporidium canis TaxID=195482 RepID=A0A9D5HZI3_9CRYT|nr:putative signal peptide-containing protein [Cryptosporidium canis]
MYYKAILALISLLCLFLTDLKQHHGVHGGSLIKLRSLAYSGEFSPREADCIEYAEKYLEYLLLKNSFHYRTKITEKYRTILELDESSGAETTESSRRNYELSLKKLVSLSKEMEVQLDEANKLFEFLLICFRFFGEKYSPNYIFTSNKKTLKHLDFVGAQ